jgi:hypothetical protein
MTTIAAATQSTTMTVRSQWLLFIIDSGNGNGGPLLHSQR